MKIRDSFTILEEAPLPPDWDVDIWSDRVPFKTRIAYAKQRAQQIGRGSSRIAFEIPYKGRKTVLKIAMNAKGAAQNEEEARLLDDYIIKGFKIAIPMIDYDERSSYPTWIHTEYAQRITTAQLQTALGNVHPLEVLDYLIARAEGRSRGDIPERAKRTALYQKLEDLIGNYHGVIDFRDLKTKANWGLYKGKPVIIDLGLTPEVASKYYTR